MSGCINVKNAAQRSEYKHVLDESQYEKIIKQCHKMKQLQPIPNEIDLIIDEIFDALLPFRFDRDTNQAIGTIDKKKAEVHDKTSTTYVISILFHTSCRTWHVGKMKTAILNPNLRQNLKIFWICFLLIVVFLHVVERELHSRLDEWLLS